MSDVPYTPEQLNLREQMAGIDRSIAETGKLIEESHKFIFESHKMAAEARKLNRDHGLAPRVVVVGVTGGLLGMASFAARALGVLH